MLSCYEDIPNEKNFELFFEGIAWLTIDGAQMNPFFLPASHENEAQLAEGKIQQGQNQNPIKESLVFAILTDARTSVHVVTIYIPTQRVAVP